ncbi:hypothetical protein B0H67DRAFT_230150 [Lasiosphaeris hirsuta]|uniref:Uncharacterized protein n=1 Tax=Lasiosphaeris hirsuta TaxID=260670 RepID=A0AA40DTI8_9PEZI|nr:hypothetical protein B0H67DRAFT_230150 [Lasiosphaeris hirsuta]
MRPKWVVPLPFIFPQRAAASVPRTSVADPLLDFLSGKKTRQPGRRLQVECRIESRLFRKVPDSPSPCLLNLQSVGEVYPNPPVMIS